MPRVISKGKRKTFALDVSFMMSIFDKKSIVRKTQWKNRPSIAISLSVAKFSFSLLGLRQFHQSWTTNVITPFRGDGIVHYKSDLTRV
jgi:hypothetical protein